MKEVYAALDARKGVVTCPKLGRCPMSAFPGAMTEKQAGGSRPGPDVGQLSAFPSGRSKAPPPAIANLDGKWR
jgi:hypothetical protein